MNILIEKNYIKEMACGANFSYVLNDSCTFSSTEYKVLQSQANSCFVRCMKMLYNGHVQIYYLTSGYKQLSALLPSLDADRFMVICANLISGVLDVKSNGFLSCQNIDISFERIYIDQSTYKVHLLYLPVGERLFDDTPSFETELRTSLIKLIQSEPMLSSPKTKQFAAELSNGSLSLDNLYASITGGKASVPVQEMSSDLPAAQMRLVAMNAPTRVEIPITKNEFIIGKKPEAVDGVVSFNKMISRAHCKITKSGMQYMLTDLQSANGTYLNRVRLHPNQPTPIKNGDVIRLANSDFQVVMK